MRWLGVLLLPGFALSLGVSHVVAKETATVGHANSGGDTTVHISNQHAFGRSLANLPVSRLRDFAYGNRIFNTNWVTAPASVKDFDGLGPLFNRASCTGCHVRDGRGQPFSGGEARQESAVVRIGIPADDGSIGHPLLGSQIQDRGIQSQEPEARVHVRYEARVIEYPDGTQHTLQVPKVNVEPTDSSLSMDGIETSFRVAQPVFGLGLLEAVSETEILKYADPADENGDHVSGRAQRTVGRNGQKGVLGRFGWKAGQPSLIMQAASAFAGDVGITSHLFPKDDRTDFQRRTGPKAYDSSPELRDIDLQKLEFYLRALAVPARRNLDDPATIEGERHFNEIGCTHCHRPSMTTRPDAALPALSNQTIHPYTDLLLHDMGPDLADGLPEHQANGREWRTPPLWGIGLTKTVNGHTRFLHDGRARSIEEAILWHGGEAHRSRQGFMRLNRAERKTVIDFLNSL